MSTSFTPTSNWTDRTLKGRGRNYRPRALDLDGGLDESTPVPPAEPRSFAADVDDRPRSFARDEDRLSEPARAEPMGAPLAATAAPVSAAAVGPAAAEADAIYTPAYARERRRSGSGAKPWMIAVPAVLVGAGLLAWSLTGGEPAPAAPVEESVSLTAAPAAAEPLPGMPMTDLGAPPAPVAGETAVSAAAPAGATRAAPPRVTRAATRPAPAPAPAPASASTAAAAPAASEAAAPVALQPATVELTPAPAASAVEATPAPAPIIVTEPLTVPD